MLDMCLKGGKVGNLGPGKVWSDQGLQEKVSVIAGPRDRCSITRECSHCAPSDVKIPWPNKGPKDLILCPKPKSLKFVARRVLMFSGSMVLMTTRPKMLNEYVFPTSLYRLQEASTKPLFLANLFCSWKKLYPRMRSHCGIRAIGLQPCAFLKRTSEI